MHNVVVAGRRTSVRLEPLMWEALRDIARERDLPLNDLVTEIDSGRSASSLTAAIRVYIVGYYRQVAAERTDLTQHARLALIETH
ncbi:MAG: ribbon-helix-helix domain-containing protein [Alphaproteobacteria bacterium]|nr:ribbon-helix-helix domain-containing protein [Alphaproteobacteria bacterium]